MDGVDISGYVRDPGIQAWNHDAATGAALADAVKNGTLGKASIECGPLNAILDNTEDGLHDALKEAADRYLVIAYGQEAEPAAGDLFFAWKMPSTGYTVQTSADFMSVNIPLAGGAPGLSLYEKPFGAIILPKSTKTAANTANNGIDNGAGSYGGVFVYALFTSSDHNVTLTLQHSGSGTGDWEDIPGATSGAINAYVTPKFGMVELAVDEVIHQFVRWQYVKGSSTSATFFEGLIRANLAT